MVKLEFNGKNGPRHDSTVKVLPDWARSCNVGRHMQLPADVQGTLFRMNRASWLCAPELSLRWDVRLTDRQNQVCPDVWEDRWRTFRVPPGFLVVIGDRLESRVEEELILQAERRVLAERKAEFIRQRTQFHLEATRRGWLSRNHLSDEELDYRRWRFKGSTIAEERSVKGQRAKIQALVRAARTEGRCLEVLSAWEIPELRIEVDRAIRTLGVQRIHVLLSRAEGWPSDLRHHVEGLASASDWKSGPGMESFFDSATEPHRE